MAKNRTITGLGIVFNSQSNDLGGFCEVIRPEAVGKDGKVLKDSDILFLLNHQQYRGVLARSNRGKGSLKLTIVQEGVRYEFEAPPTAIGDELVANIDRGEVNTSSFSFQIAPKGETWEKRKKDYLRTITAFSGLYDISAVYNAAYTATSCELRQDVLSRSSDEWTEGQARAQRSGSPRDEQRQMRNLLELLDLKEGDKVTGDQLSLMVRMLEERGVKVPTSESPSDKEMHNFRMAYTAKAKDLRPEIRHAHEFTAEEQRLFDEFERLKRNR